MPIYYNENDPFAAEWLTDLIQRGYLPAGIVDTRSITEIKPNELDPFTQCHFFAGIGGWPLALRLANIPTTRPIWTGSCPCQPFSITGAKQTYDDSRHLWPAFRWLIAQQNPPTVIGEQVGGTDGREWLGGVLNDLEALEYTVAAADLCAASIGAPHIRSRLWWMANASGERRSSRTIHKPEAIFAGTDCHSLNTWGNYDPILGEDGITRRIESGLTPLAHGIPKRVETIRGYGNAIVPDLAAIFASTTLQLLNEY